MAIETFMGTVPEDSDFDQQGSTTPATPTPVTQPVVTPPDPLSKALEAIQKQSEMLETAEKRRRDQQSWYEKQLNDIRQEVRRPTPQEGSEDWSAVYNDPLKLKDFILSVSEQAGLQKSTLTPEEAAEVKVISMVNKFQGANPKARIPAYESFIHSYVSKLVDHPSEITEKMLKGGLKMAEELFDAAVASAGSGNGNTGGQPEAGNITRQPSNPQTPAGSATNGSTPSPVHIAGSGMAGEGTVKVKDMHTLKQMMRRVDWTKTQ